MTKKKNEWDGEERRQGKEPYYMGDRRKDMADKIHAHFVPTNNDERYQFENLVIYYHARFNVWQVKDLNKPSYEQILFEVVGYANQVDAFMWAKDFVKKAKYDKENKNG